MEYYWRIRGSPLCRRATVSLYPGTEINGQCHVKPHPNESTSLVGQTLTPGERVRLELSKLVITLMRQGVRGEPCYDNPTAAGILMPLRLCVFEKTKNISLTFNTQPAVLGGCQSKFAILLNLDPQNLAIILLSFIKKTSSIAILAFFSV